MMQDIKTSTTADSPNPKLRVNLWVVLLGETSTESWELMNSPVSFYSSEKSPRLSKYIWKCGLSKKTGEVRWTYMRATVATYYSFSLESLAEEILL